MKFYLAFRLAAATLILAGCASGRHGLVLDPVGPGPAAVVGPADRGRLVVYSACDTGGDFNRRDPNRPVYSDYKLFSADGALLRKVHNDSGTLLQEPATVELAAGHYRLHARANGYGWVTVPLIVEDGKTTIVHLEGGDEFGIHRTGMVRLPDGNNVGWRAN